MPLVTPSALVEFKVRALPRVRVPPTASNDKLVVLSVRPLVVMVLLDVPRKVNVMPDAGDQFRLVAGNDMEP